MFGLVAFSASGWKFLFFLGSKVESVFASLERVFDFDIILRQEPGRLASLFGYFSQGMRRQPFIQVTCRYLFTFGQILDV